MRERVREGKTGFLFMLLMVLLLTAMSSKTVMAGDSISTATAISLGKSYSGSITSSNKCNFYSFSLSSSGLVKISGTTYVHIYMHIYDSEGNLLADKFIGKDSNTGQGNMNWEVYLTSGTYYFDVSRCLGYYGDFKFSVSYTSSGESFKETSGGINNSIATASKISLGKTYKGQIAVNDSKDFYKFNLSSSKTVAISGTSYLRVYLYIYDSKGNQIEKANYPTSTVGYNYDYSSGVSINTTITLSAGTYYLGITRRGDSYGPYSFCVKEAPCSHSYKSSTVKPTYFAQGYTKHTCSKCGASYKDNYTSKKSLSISSLTNKSGYVQVKWSKVSGAKGYYVYRKTGSGAYKKIATIKSGSTVSYKDKTAKNGTTYTYKVAPYKSSATGAGSGKKIVYMSGNKISSAKNSSKGKLVIKWSKNSKASGYQIQWSKKSGFSSKSSKKVKGASKKTYTISGLKKGTKYYVRIRPYKTVSGKTYYGAWSSKKSVRIKK